MSEVVLYRKDTSPPAESGASGSSVSYSLESGQLCRLPHSAPTPVISSCWIVGSVVRKLLANTCSLPFLYTVRIPDGRAWSLNLAQESPILAVIGEDSWHFSLETLPWASG